jgi:glycosyltransferase involved in cell wall biosynthesis
MRILVSAAACNPRYGSESAVGWKTALTLAQSYKVHVLTSLENRDGIEECMQHAGISNLSFSYFGHSAPYHPNRLIARAQSWSRYLRWTNKLLGEAARVRGASAFDLVHHVTLSTYRVASPLWKLGLPFVFGPIGGGERLPWVAASSMSRGQRIQEGARVLADMSTKFSRKLRQTIQHSTVLIASNKATAETLLSLGADPKAMRVFPVVFFTRDQIQDIRNRRKSHEPRTDHLKLFSSGMLEGRKGLSIAIRAVRLAVDSGLKIEFTIPSRGPEFSFLRELAHKLGLADVIHFPQSLPREEYWAKLLASDIYMAPSLRDNCPATLLEAMLCRCVPIVANCNGPGEVVSEKVGEVIEPDRPEQMAGEIAARLIRLARNRSELVKKAEAASDYVASTFTETCYLQHIEEAYAAARASHTEKQQALQ